MKAAYFFIGLLIFGCVHVFRVGAICLKQMRPAFVLRLPA